MMAQTQQPKHTPQNRIIGDHTRQIERLTREKADLLAALIAADAFISYQTRLWEDAPHCFDLVRAAIARAKGSEG